MSGNKFIPAGMGTLVITSGIGAGISAAVLAAAAAWMAKQGLPPEAAQPLGALAVTAGGLLGSLCAGFCRKERGLMTGAVQGGLLAMLLAGLTAFSGGAMQNYQLLCCGLALTSGCVGGMTGMSLREKMRL